jgi:hypothetical protein
MSISTDNLKSLPGIERLKRVCQSIAMLDAIICQEWEYRYYSFNSKWCTNEMMASMRNGQGSHYFILFFVEGAMIKGFDIDAPINNITDREFWINQLNQIPKQFSSFIEEPAFVCDEATFFIWRLNDDTKWQTLNLKAKGIEGIEKSDDFDGSKHLIPILDGSSATYKRWADSYYEGNYDLNIIEKIYEHEPLTEEIVEALNPDIDYELLIEDIEEIGFVSSINKV